MCREFGKIDQNFSIKLLTNMDQYAAIYEEICPNCPIDITFKMGYAQLHMYINLDITIVY